MHGWSHGREWLRAVVSESTGLVMRRLAAGHSPGLELDRSDPKSGRITVKALYRLDDEAMRVFGWLSTLYTQSGAYGWILDHHSAGVTIRSGNWLR